MAVQINKHVERLHRHLPFGPRHEAIYEEYQITGESISIPTRALEKLQELSMLPNARLVVLTGDAGHGKTYLCRNLIQDVLGYNEEQARSLLTTSCDGGLIVPTEGMVGMRPLRIFKDLSEMDIDVALDAMLKAIEAEDSLVVACVNEGRLRALLGRHHGGRLQSLQEAFQKSFDTGRSSLDGKDFIVNLNYQSVGARRLVDNGGLVRDALAGWLDGRRWQNCKDCDSAPLCPILHNVTMLRSSGAGDEVSQRRSQRLRGIFAVTERLGTVVTIRELLMTLAYILTGGLHCKDVHSNVKREKKGWQHGYAFYSLLFEAPPEVRKDNLERIPVLPVIARLDPGLTSSRDLDEGLVNSEGRFRTGLLDLSFKLATSKNLVDGADGIESIQGEAKTSGERAREAADVLMIVRALRRKDFFEAPEESEMSTFRRLGFESYDDFRWVLDPQRNEDPKRRARIKNRIIAGLHTIQGLNIRDGETTLHLVDPAFGRTTREAAIIARKIPGNQVRVISQSEAWNLPTPPLPESLQDSVEWIERSVIVRFGVSELFDLKLNLLAFECVIRASSGYLPRAFYAQEVRRVLNALGRLAERNGTTADSGIDLFIQGRSYSVSIEEGNIIQVSGTGLA